MSSLSKVYNVQCITLEGKLKTFPITAYDYKNCIKEFKIRFKNHKFIKAICPELV